MSEETNRRDFLATSISGLSIGLLALRTDVARAALEFARPRNLTDVRDFSFLHFSDTHIDPRSRDQPYNKNGRSVQALEWLTERSGEPVIQEAYGLKGGLPAFAIHTGDVLEYGPVDRAWTDFETAVSRLACPVCVVPGNHDNTWGEINHLMRHTYGNDSYSFDYGSCHFVCINSSGLLDPLPCLDRRTLDWVDKDLANVPPSTPLFIALHHPLSEDAGYASEFDKLRLWKLLHGRKVALIMDGHWHTVHCRKWQGIDRVNGGAMFGEHTGYNSITLSEGILRIVFEYKEDSELRPKTVPLLEKPLDEVSALHCHELELPNEVRAGEPFHLVVKKVSSEARGRAWIDNHVKQAQRWKKSPEVLSADLPTTEVCPGWHFVSARVRTRDGRVTTTGERFKILPAEGAPYEIYETNVGAGVKARPVVSDDLICVANTCGTVFGLSPTLKTKWSYDTRSQIVHSLTRADGRILIGDIDGVVHSLRVADGGLEWRAVVPNAIYAAPGIAGRQAYYFDASGYCSSICYDDGQVSWSRKIADIGFESEPHVHEHRLIAAAWDGFIYSIDSRSGGIDWRTWNPKGHIDIKSRYYGAADCPTTTSWNALYACDRAWVLGQYSLGGEFQRVVLENVASISARRVGQGLYAKTLNDRLLQLDPSGRTLWESQVMTGRAPTQPMEVGKHVAVLSDTGILSVLDSETGAKWIEYSVSPRLFCLSGIGSDALNTLVMGDMDGLVTCMVLGAEV